MKNSKHCSRSLLNLKLIRICISNRFNTKPLERDTYRKYTWQPKFTLYKPSSYKKQSNTFCWNDNCEIALFDITSIGNSYTNLTKVFWEYVSKFDFAVKTYLYFPRINPIDSRILCFQYKILHNTLYLNQKFFLFRKHNTSLCHF